MSDREDEFKKLEEEMVEKGAAVTPVVKTAPPSTDDIERALEQSMEEKPEEPEFISPEEEKEDKKKKKRAIFIVVIIFLLIGAGVGGYFLYRILGPSTTKADLAKSFGVGEGEVALIVDGKISEKKGRIIDGVTYIPEDIAETKMDDRIYVDTKEKLLSYVTESEGVTDYKVDEESDGTKPLIFADGTYYVSLPFIASHASCEYKEYSDPARIAVFHDRAKTYQVATLGEDTRVRTGPGIKYPYMIDMSAGDEIFIDMERQEENEFCPVVTVDGVTGYIPMASICKQENRAWNFSSEPVSFTQKKTDDTVCMGWHNIGSENYTSMPVNLGVAESVNVLSPTWLIIKNNKGGLKSIANQTYVDAAHQAGKKVWVTIRDFPVKKLNLKKVLGQTTPRRKLISNILKNAKEFGYDGINVDFEKVTEEAATGYLQFLRELVIGAHKMDLVVSSDNYPIREYNLYYNPTEQGRIVDYVVFMAYDEHYAGSEEAGSVSSLLYVEDAIAKGIQRVPAERVICGIPFFTRLWLEDTKADESLTSEVLTMGDAENWIWNNDVKAKWDKELGQYYAEYKASKTKTYKLWLENERSVKAKLKAIKKQNIAGVAFWSMGSERAITWETINEVLG